VAVICAGIVFSYSIVGLAWPLATLAIWGLTIPEVRTAVSPRRVLQWLARPLGIAVSLAVVAAVLVLGVFGPFGFGKVFVQVAGANTYGPTSPAEVFGFWTASNYRLEAPGGAALPWLTTAIAVIAVLCGLIWWIRRRELAVPAALGAGALIYILNLTPLSGDYVRSKALMILAPLMMLVAVRALLSAPWPGFRPPRAAWGALAVVFLLGAAYSTFLVLRDAPVAPPGHGAELRAFLPRIAGKPVLYAGQDRFAVYELRGSDAHVPVVEFTDKEVVERPTKPFDAGDSYSPIDFDSFSPGTLDRFDYVVTSADAYASQPPRNFKQVQRTPSYKLWQRRGPTPASRQTLLEGGAPAAHVDCHTPEMKVFTAAPGRATLFPRPYLAAKRDWSDGPYIHTGERTSQALDLPAGRWRLSLQYFSPVNLHLTATPKGGAPLKVRLPAALDGQRPNQLSLFNNGQFWPVGTLNVTRPGPVELSIQAAGASTLQRLTGYDGTAYLGELAATSTVPEKTVPLARSCGGWIDWYDGRVSP
jgi:hypothetical protein